MDAEGFSEVVYKDTQGILTIGYGFNLQALAAPKICQQFDVNIDDLKSGLAPLPKETAYKIFEK